MSSLADDKFDFDDEVSFSEAELAEIEALSLDEDLDLDLDDGNFDLDLDLSDEELAELGDEFWNENDAVEKGTVQAVAPPTSVEDTPAPLKQEAVITPTEEAVDMPLARDVVPAIVGASIASDTDYATAEDDAPTENDHRPVPRINIHAFCETEALSALVQQSAADRRLAKAHVTIQMGGASKAADYFTESSTPHLIILEITSAGAGLDASLAGLAEVCDPSTKVVIVGPVNDIRLYRDLMSKGISDYLVNPRTPVQLIRSISSIFADPSAPPIGRNIAFVGTRGGVGSSTICHNVAWSIAEQLQSDTVLLDLDLPFGTAALDFEQDPSQGLAEALTSPERLDTVLLERLLQKCTDRLSLFSAPNLLDRDYDLPIESFEAVLDIVRTSAPNILIDVPHVWTGWSQHVLKTADDIVVVATPDLASFRNAKALYEVIKQSRGNDQLPYLLLNQTNVPKRPEVSAEQFAEDLEVTPFDSIDWDPQTFGMATTNGEPIFEVGPKSNAAEVLARLSRKLLGLETAEVKKFKFSLKTLLGR